MRFVRRYASSLGLYVFQRIYPKTYNGVYKTFSSAENSLKKTLHYTNSREVFENYNKIPVDYNTFNEKYLKEAERYSIQRFNFLPTFLAGFSQKNIKILDIGSGWSNTQELLKASQVQQKIHVINYDLPEYYTIAKENPKGLPNLNFVEKITDPKKIDIAYFGSSISYINDWKSILKTCKTLKPEFIVVTDTTFTAGKTFCTLQKNVTGRDIPKWIFSESEFSKFLNTLGFIKQLETNSYSPPWNLKGNRINFELKQKNLIYRRIAKNKT